MTEKLFGIREVRHVESVDPALADALAWVERFESDYPISDLLHGFVAGRRSCPCQQQQREQDDGGAP